jgi:hypothetical protein
MGIDQLKTPVASVKRHPGLFDLLGEPGSLLQVRSFAETEGIRHSGLGQALASYKPPDGPLMSFSMREVAERLRDFLMGQRVEVLAEANGWIGFSIHVLHCPPAPGAEASLAVETEESEEASCRIEVAGVGGGAEFSLGVKATEKFSVKAESLTVTYAFRGVWEKCRMGEGRAAVVFPRLKEVDKDIQRMEARAASATALDPLWGKPVQTVEVDLRATKATTLTKSLEITQGTKWEASSALEVLGFKLGPKYSVTLKAKTVCEYSLPPGYNYLGARFERAPWWWWRLGS